MRMKDVDNGFATLREYAQWHSLGLPSFRSRRRFSQQPWNVWYPKRAGQSLNHDNVQAPDPRWNPYAVHAAFGCGVTICGDVSGREIRPKQVPWEQTF